jgi:hypothetical protein
MLGLPALPGVHRNCGTVTCSFYFSQRETVELKQQADSVGLGGAAANGLALS